MCNEYITHSGRQKKRTRETGTETRQQETD